MEQANIWNNSMTRTTKMSNSEIGKASLNQSSWVIVSKFLVKYPVLESLAKLVSKDRAPPTVKR